MELPLAVGPCLAHARSRVVGARSAVHRLALQMELPLHRPRPLACQRTDNRDVEVVMTIRPVQPTVVRPTLPSEIDPAKLLTIAKRVAVRRKEWGRLRRQGWDGDDITSEVVMAVITRCQSEKSRYDPARGSVEAYVNVVACSRMRQLLERMAQPAPCGGRDALELSQQMTGMEISWERPAGWQGVSQRTSRRRKGGG